MEFTSEVVFDGELDGQPDSGAIGDDTSTNTTTLGSCIDDDDEDGVTLSNLTVGSPATADVFVTGSCLVNGWIDWNGNNNWNDPGEQIITEQSVSGSATFNFNVPSTAIPGSTYARFRCNTELGMRSSGLALDGEVEDYLVVIVPLGCGDGVVVAPEECDDGNLIDDDGCDSNCTFTVCGNGIITSGEQCDDGNNSSLDGCQPDCTTTRCSAGRMIPGYCATKGNDCTMEICSDQGSIPLIRKRDGLPGNYFECRDGENCDVGPAGDGACTFRFNICFNVNNEARFDCISPGALKWVKVRNSKQPIKMAIRDAIEQALVDLGGTLQIGKKVPGTDLKIPSKRAVLYDPPLTEVDACTRDIKCDGSAQGHPQRETEKGYGENHSPGDSAQRSSI